MNNDSEKVKGVWPETRNGKIFRWVAQMGSNIGRFQTKQAAVRKRAQWEAQARMERAERRKNGT